MEEGLFDIPGITEYRPAFASHAQLERAHFCLPTTRAVSTDSHLAAAGGAIRAARLVLDGHEDRAFALVRPPGHHAMRVVHGNRGFCNINNEAVMAEYIRDHYPHPDGRPLRIAIVDTDVHHGDGTQDVFWNDPHTLFISLHQDGRTLYPGTGFLHECGGPGALGRTINIPLPPETCDAGYLYAVEHAVLPILEDFKPDFIINSAGQDNHFTDPLANMKLSAQGYAALTRLLNPHVAVLEGGYAIRGALPYVNLGICLALAGIDAGDVREPGWSPESTLQPACAKKCATVTSSLLPRRQKGKRKARGRTAGGCGKNMSFMIRICSAKGRTKPGGSARTAPGWAVSKRLRSAWRAPCVCLFRAMPARPAASGAVTLQARPAGRAAMPTCCCWTAT